MTFLGVTEHFSGKNGALRWSILVGKQKHNVQRPTTKTQLYPTLLKAIGRVLVVTAVRSSGKLTF